MGAAPAPFTVGFWNDTW